MGGIPFFSSLLSLIYLGITNSIIIIIWLPTAYLRNILFFILAFVIGAWMANYFIRGHFSVLLHEFKHSFISGLVGNKFEGYKIRKNHGHFEYKYSKETKKYNALIALAPYFLPVFTVPVWLISGLIFADSPARALMLIGVAYGADCALNYRDIGPHQTDFTNLTGGYWIGIFFVTMMNLTILTMVLAWVIGQNHGLKFLFYSHFLFWRNFFGI